MEIKTVIRHFLTIGIIFLFLISESCKKDDKEEAKIIKEKVTGQVQKGPFINGTAISMYELNSSLDQTGKIFTTEISSNVGSFQINNVTLSSSFVEFSASGYYFDEVKGDISVAPLNLFALSDITDISTVNVNLLTHLEKTRVEYLINHDTAFVVAKKKAQAEIMAIFGFTLTGMDESEALDISVDSEGNAALLAISIILQGNRSVGDLTELMATITNDIGEDGTLNNGIVMNNLRNSTKDLDLTKIRLNLVNRYQNLGITATIPQFEKYINSFLVFTGQVPSLTPYPVTDIATTSAKFNGIVTANSLPTRVIFQYGETVSYTDSITATQSPITGNTPVAVSATKTGLLPGTTYHVRVKTRNDRGTVIGEDMEFKTLGKVPAATTLTAENIQLYSATLSGIVDPFHLSTSVTFEWGTTLSYGNSIQAAQSPVTGDAPVNVSTDLTGLLPGTVYHYKIKAENLLGVTYSNDLTLTTLGSVPTAITQQTSVVQSNSAIINGTVNPNLLASDVTFEWGTTTGYGTSVTVPQSPVTGNSVISVKATLNGLNPGTLYHYRIKAVNEIGTTAGTDLTFTATTPVTDSESNSYNTVAIGSQVWMAENLKTTKYSNGDLIGTTLSDIGLETTPKYQWAYDNNEINVPLYGRLYTWYAVADVRNICPTGWHVPSDAEWTTFTDYLTLNGFGYQGSGTDIAKSIASASGWNLSIQPGTAGNDQVSNNVTGFSALPGGYRFGNGTFENVGVGNWWTATEYGGIPTAWWRSMGHMSSDVSRANFAKVYGMSVRCIKN